MGKYTRKKCSNNSSGVGEVAVMEVAQAGVRTRGRAMTPAAEGDNSGSVKRRKVDIGNGELRLPSLKSVRGDVISTLKNYADSGEENLRDPCGDATSVSSGDVQASCCSSNGSITEKPKSADLEEEAEIETTMIRYKLNGRESTPTSELIKEESGELESSNTTKPSVLIESPAGKTPPAAELEEFFAAAEQDLHKRFKDKYNYDIVKDVPLKGRYEWVELNP